MLLNFNGVYRMTRIREPFKIEYVCSMGRSSPSTLRQPEFRTSPAALRRLWGMDPPKDLQKTNMDSRWLIHVRTLHLLRFQGFFLLSNFFLMFFLVGLPVKSHGDGNYPSLSITKGIFKRSVSGAGILDYRRVTPLQFHVLKSISEVFPSWKKSSHFLFGWMLIPLIYSITFDLIQVQKIKMYPWKFNSSPPKNDGWKTIISYGFR